MTEQADELKEELRKMIKSTSNLSQQLHLIDVLERLCLDYHFEKEIDGMLSEIYKADINNCDLQTVALWFYILRMHGYKVSPDVFQRFKDEEGSFATNNLRDLLSLYNAAYTGIHGETILDEAISFTRRNIESMAPYSKGPLENEINCALNIPLPRRVRIYELNYYISVYEKDAMRHDTILELAKLNANIIRFQCQEELKIITGWDPETTHELPEYMKFVFNRFLHTFQGIENELAPEEKYQMCYLKKLTTDLAIAYNEEAKWRDVGYIPATVEEHLQVSAISIAGRQLSCASFVGMGDMATKQLFDWVYSMPRIVHALCRILRLSDDLKSREREQMMKHVASTVDSCMKEHRVPLEVANKKIEKLIEQAWKDLNEEWFNPNNTQPMMLIMRIVNLARTTEFMYKQGDAFTNSHALKDTISSLFVGPTY